MPTSVEIADIAICAVCVKLERNGSTSVSVDVSDLCCDRCGSDVELVREERNVIVYQCSDSGCLFVDEKKK